MCGAKWRPFSGISRSYGLQRGLLFTELRVKICYDNPKGHYSEWCGGARDGRIGDGRDRTRQCAEPNTAHTDIPINRPY